MGQRARDRTDFVPHLPDLIVAMGRCFQAIRDAQTEVDPFGPNFAALEEAGVALDALGYRLTGQRGFFRLGQEVDQRNSRHAPTLSDGEPF